MRKYIASLGVFLFIISYSTSIFLMVANGGAVAEGTALANDTTLSRSVNIFIFIYFIFSTICISWTGFLQKKFFFPLIVFCFPYFYVLIQSLLIQSYDRILVILTYPFVFYISLYLYNKNGYNFLLKLFLFSLSVIYLISLLFIFFIPEYGIGIGTHQGAWQGAFIHKNSFGFFLFLYALILCVYYYNNKKNIIKLIVIIFTILITALMTKSSTSIMLLSYLFTFLVIFGMRSNRLLNSLTTPLAIFSSLILILILMIVFSNYLSLYLEKGAGFSSRDLIWLSGINIFLEYPVFGVGYGSTEILKNVLYKSIYAEISSFHNSYIDILIYFGLFGVFIFAYLYVLLVNKIRYNGFLGYGILLPFLIYIFFESLLFGQTISMLFLFVIFNFYKLK
jgi:O-antigen ligase